MDKNQAAAELGRLGGRKKSDKKAASSKENGKKGGRPKDSERLSKFKSFKKDAGLKNVYAKLSSLDVEKCLSFIKEHDHLNFNEFAAAINRWDFKKESPTKRATDMWALVMQSNGVLIRDKHC